MTNYWILCSLEEPDEDGIYEVQVAKKGDSLSCPSETIMEYYQGEWILRLATLINEDYRVIAWRPLGKH